MSNTASSTQAQQNVNQTQSQAEKELSAMFTASSTQVQQKVTQIQSQLRKECSALFSELSNVGDNAMTAETNSRYARIGVSVLAGIILGIIFIVSGLIIAGILLGAAGIGIAYLLRFDVAEESRLNQAINVFKNSLNQNSFPK